MFDAIAGSPQAAASKTVVPNPFPVARQHQHIRGSQEALGRLRRAHDVQAIRLG